MTELFLGIGVAAFVVWAVCLFHMWVFEHSADWIEEGIPLITQDLAAFKLRKASQPWYVRYSYLLQRKLQRTEPR